jgi:hypothetical protein
MGEAGAVGCAMIIKPEPNQTWLDDLAHWFLRQFFMPIDWVREKLGF